MGGASLLLAAGKPSTFNMTSQFVTDNQYHTEFIRCLRTISRELGIPVELASPEQFIPLPRWVPGSAALCGTLRLTGCFSL